MAQVINLMGTSKWLRSSIWLCHPKGPGHQFGRYIQMNQVINLLATFKWFRSILRLHANGPCHQFSGNIYSSGHKFGGYIKMTQVNLVASSNMAITMVATSKWPCSSIWWLHPNDSGHQSSGIIQMDQVIILVASSK